MTWAAPPAVGARRAPRSSRCRTQLRAARGGARRAAALPRRHLRPTRAAAARDARRKRRSPGQRAEAAARRGARRRRRRARWHRRGDLGIDALLLLLLLLRLFLWRAIGRPCERSEPVECHRHLIVAAGALARHTERVGRLVHAVRLRFRLHLRCHTCEQLGRALPDAVHSRHGWHALLGRPHGGAASDAERRALRRNAHSEPRHLIEPQPPCRPCGRPRARRHPPWHHRQWSTHHPGRLRPSPAPPGALPRRQMPRDCSEPAAVVQPHTATPSFDAHAPPAAVQLRWQRRRRQPPAPFPGGERGAGRVARQSRPTQHAAPRRRRRPRVWRSARGLRHPRRRLHCGRWSGRGRRMPLQRSPRDTRAATRRARPCCE